MGILLWLLVYPLLKRRIELTLSLLILASSMLMFISRGLFPMYLFFELALFPIVFMILRLGNQPERISASSLLLIYTLFRSVPFLVLLLLLIKRRVSPLYLTEDKIRIAGRILLLLPFFFKLPIVGAHLWLPKAHVESPTLGSILLAGILLKLGRYGIYRLYPLVRRGSGFFLFLLLGGRALISFLTSTQRDSKMLIAYSSVGHMNLGVILLFLIIEGRREGFVLSNFFHMIVRGLMFFIVGMLFYSRGTRIVYLLKGWRGFYFFLQTVLVLSANVGVPPLLTCLPEIISTGLIFLVLPGGILLLGGYLFFVRYFSFFLYRSLAHSFQERGQAVLRMARKSIFLFIFMRMNPVLLLI